MQFRILGGLRAEANGSPVALGPPKQRSVLAYLLLEPGRVVPIERLIDLIWPDDAPAAAGPSLQAYVSNLRRAIEPDRRPRDPARLLLTEPTGYRLAVDRADLDATRLEDLVAQGRALVADGDHGAGAEVLAEALGLWAGPPLPELADAPPVVEATSRLLAVHAAALEGAAEARLALGEPEAVARVLEPEAEQHAFREHLQALLALAQYRSGRQADALRTIDATRRRLLDDLGLDPGPELRKLEEAVLAHAPELDLVPAPGARATPPPSTRGRGDPARPKVAVFGRERELSALSDLVDGLADRRGGAALLIGEPGIGKTHLAEAVAARAEASGVAVAWARCPDGGALPPYWPILRAIGQLVEQGVVVPPEQRARGFTQDHFAVLALAERALATADRPAVVVIDDVQWADADSARLLELLVPGLRSTTVLVLLTARPVEETTPDGVVDLLAELARVGAPTFELTGLTGDAIADWLRTLGHGAVSDEGVAVVRERTEGNPLFVRELNELLAADAALGAEDADRLAHQIPNGVRLVVRRRVSGLPGPTQQLLSTCSIVGRTFDASVAAAVVERSVDGVLEDLEPALAVGLVVPDEPGRYRFSHALVADALAAEVNDARRARLHAATARALAAQGDDDRRAALVAQHALAGAVAGTAPLAYEAAVRAATLATSRLAHLDAAELWAQAVHAVDLARPQDVAARTQARLERARAQARADLPQLVQQSVTEVIELARGTDDVDSMAEAAALLNRVSVWANQAPGTVDPVAVALLEEVLDRLPADHSRRSRILGALTDELCFSPDAARLERISAEAVALAEAGGDPEDLGLALTSRYHATMRPDGLRHRLDVAQRLDRLRESSEADLPPDLRLLVPLLRAAISLEAGDVATCDAELERGRPHEAAVTTTALRSQLPWFRSVVALLHGRYDEARRAGDVAHDSYRRADRIQADLVSLALDLGIRFDLGDPGSLPDLVPVVAPMDTALGAAWRELLLMMLLEAGDRASAEPLIPRPGTTLDLPPTPLQLITLTSRAHSLVELGDVDGAGLLLDRLRPYAGRIATAGAGPPTAGAVDLALARLQALTGDDGALATFDRAVAVHERIGAPAWLARSLLHRARHLRQLGGADRTAQATADLGRVGAIAGSFGLARLARLAATAD